MGATSSQPVEELSSDAGGVACPGVGELSAFSRGALPLASLRSIAQHVSACAKCDSKVSTLVSEMDRRQTEHQMGASRPAAESGQLDLAEARIDASGSQAAHRSSAEEGPTAPLRLGQYRLLRQIGRGGMGVVYQARHEKLQRDVAIKFVPVETIQDLLDVGRLQREMTAAGTMRHPNVVYATDAGESEGIHYLVMEYVEGIDLSKLVSRVGTLPVADACEIIRQAAQGLAHVDQQQLVHRDLKPSNLMLATDGTVKILDLGLARAYSIPTGNGELTREGYLLGTIDYASPEQAHDAHAVDIRSDIYSLGCTFYKLLTGVPPFGGPTQKSVASKILAHEKLPPPPLVNHREDVPAEVEEILHRMLAKNPAERFQTPDEVRRALKPYAAGADLPALLTRARIAPASVRVPALEASKASTITAMVPSAASAGRRRVPRSVLAGGGLGAMVCVAALAWLGGWLPGIGGSLPKSDRPAPTVEHVLAKPNQGQIDYPFPGEHPGIAGWVTPAGPGAIKLESQHLQLVQLGYLREDASHVSFEIDRLGPIIGVFLGYRESASNNFDLDNQPYEAPVGEFQLLLILAKRGSTPRESVLMFERKRCRIFPAKRGGPPHLHFGSHESAKSMIEIPIPAPGEKLPVRIEFSGRGLSRQISRIVINDVPLHDLVDQRSNGRPVLPLIRLDYGGRIGLYNHGTLGTATFSNFDLSQLEKE